MNVTRERELRLIAQDGWEIRQLVDAIRAHPHGGIIGLTLAPYVSFYVVEACERLHRLAGRGVRIPQLTEIDEELRRIRSRLKLLDSDRADIERTLAVLSAIEEGSNTFFARPHRGILGPLKRWLQKDLGMYFCGQDLICTTHVGLVNSGLDPTRPSELVEATEHDISRRWHEYSRTLGSFVGALTTALEPIVGSMPTRPSAPAVDLPFSAEDYKARDAYTTLGLQIGTDRRPLTAAVTWLVSQVNFVHHVLRRIEPSSRGMCFRIRYLTVFHALDGLRRLGAILRRRRDSRMAIAAAEILRRGRELRGQRPLRNALAHPYDLGEVEARIATGVDPLDAVVRHFSRRTSVELTALLDQQLAVMSDQFRNLVSAGSLGGQPVRW
jgi:hypothetical protein